MTSEKMGSSPEELLAIIARQRERIAELEFENSRLRMAADDARRRRPSRGERRSCSAASEVRRDSEEPLFESKTPTRLAHARRGVPTPPAPATPPPPQTPPPPEKPKPRRGRLEASLWIAHDNWPLGSAVADLIASGRAAEVLVEAQRTPQSLCMVLGRVAYSGTVEAAPRVSGAFKSGSRGASCFELSHCYARVLDLSERTRPGSSDFGCLPLVSDAPPCALRSPADAARFFQGCVSRVDVILSPQRICDDGRAGSPSKSGAPVDVRSAPWLPYWDSESPPRKLAPQFRSAGVGYIRLGDDMSRHGLAFVSADGDAFLSDAASADPPVATSTRARPQRAAIWRLSSSNHQHHNDTAPSRRHHHNEGTTPTVPSTPCALSYAS